jgi:uncharacterized protein (DUF1330 family)
MQNLAEIAIDWANVNWLYVTVLAIFVFFSTIIGTILSFKHVFYGAVLSALLFAAAFVFWNYYPHELPLPTLMTAQQQLPATHTKSPTYVVIAIQKITDPEAYKPLPEKGRSAAEAAGGHYLIRTGNITGLDGVAPERLALIEFDSIEKAQAWYNSPAQKDADAIRSKSTDSLAFIVEGLGK